MKNRDILVKLSELKKEDCIHPIFNFFTFNDGSFLTSSPVPNCSTMGCLAGELPGLDPDWYFNERGSLRYTKGVGSTPSDYLAEYFDLSLEVVGHLFISCNQLPEKYGGVHLTEDNVTLSEVQSNLKEFLLHNEK